MKETVESANLRKISVTLAKLAERVDRSASSITSQRAVEQVDPPTAVPMTVPARNGEDNLGLAEALFSERRRRDNMFNHIAGLLGETAWDILLFLYIGGRRQWAVSSAHLTRAIGVSSTSTLRCIARLEADGSLHRATDAFDRRRTLLRLSDDTTLLLDDYLTSLRPTDH